MKKENLIKAIELRRYLHKYPELSNKEYNTKRKLMDFIRDNTNLEIIDRDKWFYLAHRFEASRDRNIAFRADFDALAMNEDLEIEHRSRNFGVSHKCGHDGHAAALAGLALEIDRLRPERNVFLLFQHAEETGQGALEAQVIIEEEDIKEIYAFHNWSNLKADSINIMDGVCQYASKGLIIDIEGRATHASQPELGVNPAYTIAKVINALEDLTSLEENKGLTLATVIGVEIGDKSFGIAASKGRLLLTIRASYQEDMDRLQENIEDIIIQDANGKDINYSIREADVFPETFNHKKSADKVRQAAKNKGYELVEMDQAYRSSEDFGYFTQKTEGAMFYIGNGYDYPAIHTANYDFRDDNIEIAVDMFMELINS